MRRLVILGCLTALAATPAMSQRAQNSGQNSELSGLQAEYRDERVRARRLRADAAEASAELATLEKRLATLRTAENTDDAQISAQRARLDELQRRDTVLVVALSRERDRQGRLLSALQLMSRDPPPPLLVPADKAVDTVRAAILMRAMEPELRRRADALVAQQRELARIRRLAVLSSEQLLTTESAQEERRSDIQALSARKAALLTVLRADAARAERAAAVLEARIRSLGGEIRPLTENEAEPVATRLPGGRSRLTAPVSGTPSVGYGNGSSGLRWKVDRGVVASPAPAVVDYAGPLSGWGEVVILDLGPGWRVVLAGLDTLSVQPGTRLTEGQAIGRSGADGEVYFELRRDERPIDPSPWVD